MPRRRRRADGGLLLLREAVEQSRSDRVRRFLWDGEHRTRIDLGATVKPSERRDRRLLEHR
jgi:hypothetical protein